MQRRGRRPPLRRVALVVGADLHQLDEVVAEPPEQLFGGLERQRIVELVERGRHARDQSAQLGDEREIELNGDVLDRHPRVVGADAIELRQHEAAGVHQLGREPLADADDLGIEGGVGAEAVARRPVAVGVGRVLAEEVLRRDHVPLRLGHLLAVGIEPPAADGDVPPRDSALVEPGLDDGVEGPGADDVVRLRAQVHREHPPMPVGIAAPPRDDLRRERGGRPGVHHVGIADEAARLAALLLAEPARRRRQWIERQVGRFGEDRALIVDRAVAANRIPDRERHAGEALPTHAPVLIQALDPVLVPRAHVGGVPLDPAALLEQLVLDVEDAHEPLACRHELERAIPLLVELDRVLDRSRLAYQRCVAARRRAAGLGQQLDHSPARLLHRLADQLRVGGVGSLGIAAGERFARVVGGDDAPVGRDELAQRQTLRLPELDVVGVAEGAHHEDAGPLLGIGVRRGQDRHRRAVERRDRGPAEQVAIARIVGVSRQRHAGADQLRPRGRDHDLAAALDRET